MPANSYHRGHKIYYEENAEEWRYEDDQTLVSENWKSRPCGKCSAHFTKDGHDPCIANLPKVSNACCGHGNDAEAYVQFDDGQYSTGKDAIALFDSFVLGNDSDAPGNTSGMTWDCRTASVNGIRDVGPPEEGNQLEEK